MTHAPSFDNLLLGMWILSAVCFIGMTFFDFKCRDIPSLFSFNILLIIISLIYIFG